jgi:hypothetical protein
MYGHDTACDLLFGKNRYTNLFRDTTCDGRELIQRGAYGVERTAAGATVMIGITRPRNRNNRSTLRSLSAARNDLSTIAPIQSA